MSSTSAPPQEPREQHSGPEPNPIAWSMAIAAALWVPLLALSLYPSLETLVTVSSIRRAFGISALISALIVLAIAGVSGLGARFAAHRLRSVGTSLPAAFFGATGGSAVLLMYAAFLVRRGPERTLMGDAAGLLLVIAGAALLGGLLAGLAVLEIKRSSRTWVTQVVAIASAFVWALLARWLIGAGVAPDDRIVNVWLIAGAASLIGIASALTGRKRAVAVLLGIVAIAAAIRPAIRIRPTGPEPRRISSMPANADAPNVVIVLVDTWRYDMTGFADPSLPTTPRLLALASDISTVFTNATAPASATVPSVKAMITGLPASSFGLAGWGNTPPPVNAWTMARAFREAGYATSAFVANDNVQGGGFESGFEDYWCGSAIGNVTRSFFIHRLLARRDFWRGQRFAEDLRISKAPGDAVVDRFTRWVDGRGKQPFFSYIHLVEPHWPYQDHGYGFVSDELRKLEHRHSFADLQQLTMGDPANTKYRGTPALRETVARYQEEVREADRLIGRIADELSARKLLDDTILVFVGDHGEEFFEHNGYGHGHDVYEEVIHVPFVVRWPRDPTFAGFAAKVASPVSLIDVFPTLTDLLRLPPSRRPFAGRSLRQLLEGRSSAPVAIVSEAIWQYAHVAYRRENLKARVIFPPRQLPSAGGRLLLFDLASDPAEEKPIRARDLANDAFLLSMRSEVTGQWDRALKLTAKQSPSFAKPRTEKDEALERLRGLGYLQ